MVQLFLVMLAMGQAAGSPGPGAGQRLIQDRGQAATPVTQMNLIPPKIYDCRTAEEERVALDQRLSGETPQCWPKSLQQNSRR